ncbi:MAG: GNAT family N-acetyltransferase [Synergistaceae bacterium]|jgi:GNAT superfamily N-acetyltransferase|nr:GNAT family N-acetyltransferase [Synergistaceae bacterium]
MVKSDYTFRKSTAEDIPTALDLREKLFDEMGVPKEAFLDDAGTRLFEIYNHAYEIDEMAHFFAHSATGEVAAAAGALLKRDFPYLLFKPGYYGWIIDVFTEPRYRKQGLSTKLLEFVHEWLRGKGVREAKLISAGSAPRRLYERLGYRQTWEMSFNLTGQPTYNEFVDAHSNYTREQGNLQ